MKSKLKCRTCHADIQVTNGALALNVHCIPCGTKAIDGTPDVERLFYRSAFEEQQKPDAVSHPPHYTKHPSGVECITVTEHFNFNRGNAIKYIWRAGEKGNEIEDLKKAAWYINREIQRLEKNK